MTFHGNPETTPGARRRAYVPSSPYHLSNYDDLSPIVSYYENKFKIKIYIAGDIETDSPVYHSHVKAIHDLSQIFTNLAGMYMYRWNVWHLNLIVKDEIRPQLKAAGYLNEKGKLRKIEPGEIEEFDRQLISILRAIGKYEKAKTFLKRVNAAAVDEAAKMSTRFRFRKFDYVPEIKHIQAQLKDEEIVGYVMPNDGYVPLLQPIPDRTHLSMVIISKDKVIKPINFTVESTYELSEEDFPGIYTTTLDLSDLSPLDKSACQFLKHDRNPHGWIIPQLGNEECGTLGMLYLKELLKDNARQLKQFTLAFSCYMANPADESKPYKTNYFIPSPQVLRYSQSNLYNLVIYNLLMCDDDQATFIYERKTMKLMSLRKMLQDSILIAQKISDTIIVSQNQKILDELPAFRKNWLEEYQLSMQKRDSMNVLKGRNKYLEYKSRRLEKIKFRVEEEVESEPSPRDTTSIVFAALSGDKQVGEYVLEAQDSPQLEEVKLDVSVDETAKNVVEKQVDEQVAPPSQQSSGF